MNYIELTIGEDTYKLRLNTRNIIVMEKALGVNPIDILMKMDDGRLPKLTEVVIMFQAMLQTYHHGINIDKAYDLFDAYMAGGKSMFDFVSEVVVPVFQNCGLLGNAGAVDEETKNA